MLKLGIVNHTNLNVLFITFKSYVSLIRLYEDDFTLDRTFISYSCTVENEY